MTIMWHIYHIFNAVLETGDVQQQAQHKKLEQNETPESMIVDKALSPGRTEEEWPFPAIFQIQHTFKASILCNLS